MIDSTIPNDFTAKLDRVIGTDGDTLISDNVTVNVSGIESTSYWYL